MTTWGKIRDIILLSKISNIYTSTDDGTLKVNMTDYNYQNIK